MDRDQQSTSGGATRATPPKGQSKPARAKQAQGRAKDAGKADGKAGATSAPDIMSRLPKSRPQRATQRRRAPVATASKSTGGKSATSPRRPVSTAARRPVAAKAATPARPKAQPKAQPKAAQSSAPGLPRLAVDGAAEMVKMPLKVSGRLTLKALDAVARGLRRR